MEILIVDAANVVGSTPDGWWRDRAGAARRLLDRLVAAGLPYDAVVVVLEGVARRGVAETEGSAVRVMHAQASGDDAIVAEAIRQLAEGDGRRVVVATADRGLRDRVTAAGAETASPKWLLEQL